MTNQCIQKIILVEFGENCYFILVSYLVNLKTCVKLWMKIW